MRIYRGLLKRSKGVGVILLAVMMILSGVLVVAQEGGHGGGFEGEGQAELEQDSPIPLDPAGGTEIGLVYEAYLSPQQEGGEEEDTPRFIPEVFKSTEPSTPREERPGRGHAVIEFTKDLSRAYVYLALTDVNPEDIVLLHLHCGVPTQLGPIIVDFGTIGDYQEYLADGVMKVEIRNEDIQAVLDNSEGLVGAFTAGCLLPVANLDAKFTTIGGLAYVAGQGDLYFNVHTRAQTYFGDIRGQFYPVD